MCFYTPIRLHSYTVLLHTSSLCRGSFTRKNCYTEMHLTDSDRRAYTQMLAQGDVFFTHTCSFPFFLNHTCFYIELFLQRDTFTQRCVYTGMLSHTQKRCCIQILLHTFFFNTEQLNAHIAYPKTNRGAFTKDRVDTRSFYLRTFLHRHTFT